MGKYLWAKFYGLNNDLPVAHTIHIEISNVLSVQKKIIFNIPKMTTTLIVHLTCDGKLCIPVVEMWRCRHPS